ncbi:MAG: hypothetical protein QNJ89_10410 [Acidimicrobiia bacterium]|nr:hypothetical protein [Acidimicrobiia bacterium]
MATKAILVGVALIALGVIVSLASDSGSVTSLLPAFLGVVFLAIGLLARARPASAHHFMHAAAALALLAVFGSLGSAVGRGSTGWALFAQIATVIIAGIFLQQAIMSFRAARQARQDESASS